MKDPVCTRCGDPCAGFNWEYRTKTETVYLCDNCCKYALMYFTAKQRILPHEIVNYAKKELEKIA